MTAKRRLTIEMARIRRHKRLLPPIPPPPGGGGPGTGTVLGSGTVNHLAKWIAVDTLGDSIVRDDGNTVSIVRTAAAVDIFKILDTDGSLMFDMDKDGLVGINCDPDGWLTIQGGGLQAPISSGLVGWYRADSITAGQVVGGNLTVESNMITWLDSSDGGNHLTATGAAADLAARRGPRAPPGMADLPTVSFEGIITGSLGMGYFSLTAGGTAAPAAAGWTSRSSSRYSNVASDSYPFSADLGRMDSGDNFIKNVSTPNNTGWTRKAASRRVSAGSTRIPRTATSTR
jgi:hypothetical protein